MSPGRSVSTLSTMIAPLAGGILIGLAATLRLWADGRAAGVSGALAGTLARGPEGRTPHARFLLGLVAAGGVLSLLGVPLAQGILPRSDAAMAASGLLVGMGARLAGGCTSGHGVCGLSRLSPRSLLAILIFMASGALSVVLTRALAGGRL
ncbi:MAG: YeeE/YedE family protein [Elusimicrobia bacterium]|nr:YeeE/YedE family protein [Elusimicrobiota bacterium]